MEFTTKLEIDEISVYGESNFFGVEVQDVDIEARINWSVDFETREYGIKSVYVTVDLISISGTYDYYEPSDDECLELLTQKIPTLKHFTVSNEIEMGKYGISIEEMSIDFNTKTITVK